MLKRLFTPNPKPKPKLVRATSFPKKKIQYIPAKSSIVNEHYIWLIRRHRPNKRLPYLNGVCSPLLFNINSILSLSKNEGFTSKVNVKNFEKCMKSKARFIFIHLSLPGHANALIYDKVKNELEWFEPHGYTYGGSGSGPGPNANAKLLEYAKNTLQLPVNTIIHSHSPSCPIGVQGLEGNHKRALGEFNTIENKGGLCFAWTLWYLDMKFSNPNNNSRQLLNNMISKKNTDFRKFITKYIMNRQSLLSTHQKHMNVRNETEIQKLAKKFYTEKFPTLSNIKKAINTANLSQLKKISDVKQLMSDAGFNHTRLFKNSYRINFTSPTEWRLYNTFINYLIMRITGKKGDIHKIYKNAKKNEEDWWQIRMSNIQNVLLINKIANQIPRFANLPNNITPYTKRNLEKILAYNNFLKKPKNNNPFASLVELNTTIYKPKTRQQLQRQVGLRSKRNVKENTTSFNMIFRRDIPMLR
jgi:hypothetical protein